MNKIRCGHITRMNDDNYCLMPMCVVQWQWEETNGHAYQSIKRVRPPLYLKGIRPLAVYPDIEKRLVRIER